MTERALQVGDTVRTVYGDATTIVKIHPGRWQYDAFKNQDGYQDVQGNWWAASDLEHVYQTILDDRRLDDELDEARRILNNWRLMFTSGNSNPTLSRHIVANHIDVRDTKAFFERWPNE